MDLSIQVPEAEKSPIHLLMDRSDQSSASTNNNTITTTTAAKADRLDMIVGDVLARQCKAQSIDMIPAHLHPLMKDDPFAALLDHHHHHQQQQQHHQSTPIQQQTTPTQAIHQSHHDMSDDVPPTEADVPLHEWVAALTHPLLGPYPNGVTPRILDRLATEAGVIRFPDHARRRWHKMWSSSNHLCVYLSDEVKSGRLRRVRFGHYAGVFDNQHSSHNNRGSLTSSGGIGGSGASGHDTEANALIEQCLADNVHHHHINGNGILAKQDENDSFGGMETSHHLQSARPFPIMSLLGTTSSTSLARDRASSFGSFNGTRKRTFRTTSTSLMNGGGSSNNGNNNDHLGHHHSDLLLDESHLHEPGLNHRLLHASSSTSRRPKIKQRRHSATVDEFGLPSLLDDPSFANVVFSMGIDVQSWSVEQSAAFVQDFGFCDGAEAFMREEIDGTALMLLKRVDVLDGLHLKIGPAVKLYRYIRALQKLVSRRNGSLSGSTSNGDA